MFLSVLERFGALLFKNDFKNKILRNFHGSEDQLAHAVIGGPKSGICNGFQVFLSGDSRIPCPVSAPNVVDTFRCVF